MRAAPFLASLRAPHGLGPDLREGRAEARGERALRAQQGAARVRFGAGADHVGALHADGVAAFRRPDARAEEAAEAGGEEEVSK